MRITIQPAAELTTATTAPGKSSATSASPADFGAALSAASKANLTQDTHTNSDRGNDKKNDRAKSTDADDSTPVTQNPVVQLASLVLPIPPPTPAFTLGLPAPVQDAAQQSYGSCSMSSNTATSDLSTLQGVGTTSAASALLGAATSSTPAPTAQTLPASQQVPASPAALPHASRATPAALPEETSAAPVATLLPTATPIIPVAVPAPIAPVSILAASMPATTTLPTLTNTPQSMQTQAVPVAAPTASKADKIQAAVENLPVASSTPAPSIPTPAPSIPDTVTPLQSNANSMGATIPASAATQVSLTSVRTPSPLSPKTAPTYGARIYIDPTSLASVKPVTVEINPATQVQSDANSFSPAPVSDPTSGSTPAVTPVTVSGPTAMPVLAPVQTQDATIVDQNTAAAAPVATNLPAQPTSLSPTVADLTPNVSSLAFGKAQLSISAAKDGNARQNAVSSNDRSSAVDAKGKRKFDSDSNSDDSDGQLSTTASSDVQSGVKSADTSPQSRQGASDQQAAQHQAGSDAMLQQAVQASVAVASPAAHAAVQSSASNQVTNTAPATAQSVIASNVNTAPSTAVNNAQLVQSIHQSDMRLGMHSPDFGAISINTSLAHQTLSAQISTDHSELSRALAMHLPSIEEKLGNAYGIHAKVEVRDSSTASYGGPSQQQSQSQQAKGDRQGQRQGGSFMDNSTPMQATMAALSNSTASVVSSDARLDIRI